VRVGMVWSLALVLADAQDGSTAPETVATDFGIDGGHVYWLGKGGFLWRVVR
jgi:hypothetical protein